MEYSVELSKTLFKNSVDSTSCCACDLISSVFLNNWTKTATFERKISGSNGLKM